MSRHGRSAIQGNVVRVTMPSGMIDILLIDLKTSTVVRERNRLSDNHTFIFNQLPAGHYGIVVRQYFDPSNPFDYVEGIVEKLVLLPLRHKRIGSIYLKLPKSRSKLSVIADRYRQLSTADILMPDSETIITISEYGPDHQVRNVSRTRPIMIDFNPLSYVPNDPVKKGLVPYDY